MSEIAKDIGHLLPQIRELIVPARHAAARTVNTLQVVTNYEIGRLIVEHEQAGAERARYGKALLKELSASLTTEFGKGFSQSNLEYMRRFYLVYRNRPQPIGQTLSGQLAKPIKSQTVSGKSQSLPERIQSPGSLSISETLSGKSAFSERFQHLAAQFPLSGGEGFADYMIFLDGKPVGALEAKPEGYPVRSVEVQTDKYTTGLAYNLKPPVTPLPFRYVSTGAETIFWNHLDPTPRSRRVFQFHRSETLAVSSGLQIPDGK